MTPASRRSPSRVRLLLASVLALLATAALFACGTESTPRTELTPRIVQVAGHQVEVVEAGEGDATVVFESGLTHDWTPWGEVARKVASRARVLAYSRPGYGDTAPLDGPRDATHIVEQLRLLLSARGYTPPYVLVGHSFGGGYMELFAKKYPDEVAGVVLVDPRHRDMSTVCAERQFDGCIIPAHVLAVLPAVVQAEFAGYTRLSDEVRAAGPFGPYPVRVLIATSHAFPTPLEALWVSMLTSLADEAPDGEAIVFPGAGHGLQLEEPAKVTEAILSLLPATR